VTLSIVLFLYVNVINSGLNNTLEREASSLALSV